MSLEINEVSHALKPLGFIYDLLGDDVNIAARQ